MNKSSSIDETSAVSESLVDGNISKMKKLKFTNNNSSLLLRKFDGLMPKESGGFDGPNPTRYGDWENKGRCIDF